MVIRIKHAIRDLAVLLQIIITNLDNKIFIAIDAIECEIF